MTGENMKHALVPMTDEIAASPNGGKVSREQFVALKDILKSVMVGRLADDVIFEFLNTLGLEVEE